MIDNTKLLKQLMAANGIAVQDSELLHESPLALPASFGFEKIEGMLLGLAVGDSLGYTTEGQLPSERLKHFGEILDYLRERHADFRAVGAPSDDTQMTFWTLKQLIEDKGLVPDNLAKRFCQQHIFGIGNTVREFIQNYKDRKVSWQKAGPTSAGNGALMRICPVLIPYLKDPTPSLWADTALAGMVTHNDRASTASCVAFVSMLWSLLGMESTPKPGWWLETFCSIAQQLEGDTHYRPRYSGATYEGPLWKFTNEVVSDALDKNLTALEACNLWHSGAYLLETVPSVLYILEKHGSNAEEAIIRAVNDTKDNDSIAAIVGAAVGALHGLGCIPERWLKGLLGRTSSNDDGRVFKLILEAKRVFWNT